MGFVERCLSARLAERRFGSGSMEKLWRGFSNVTDHVTWEWSRDQYLSVDWRDGGASSSRARRCLGTISLLSVDGKSRVGGNS